MPDHLHLSDRARWICLLLRCVCPPRTCIWGQEVVSQCEHSSTNAVNWFRPTGKHGVIFKLTSLSSTKPHRAWEFQLAFSVLGRHLWFLWESLYFNYKEWKELRRPSYRGWCLNLISPSKQDWKIEDWGGRGGTAWRMVQAGGGQNQNIYRELRQISLRRAQVKLLVKKQWEGPGLDQDYALSQYQGKGMGPFFTIIKFIFLIMVVATLSPSHLMINGKPEISRL